MLTSVFRLIFIVFILFCNACVKSTESNVKKIKYKGIERTLGLLHQSSENNVKELNILFYGQSIIGGMKTDSLVLELKKRFPFTKISFSHKPIGGFTIPRLIKTAEHDVYDENPDLIIFHAYAGIKDGLYDQLIKNIRQRMTSDILLLDHHYVWDIPSERLRKINKSHDDDSKAIKHIAEKYDCGFVNVREQWKQYLETNKITANVLMGNTTDPNVHPNDNGNKLLREIVLSMFDKKPYEQYSVSNDSLRQKVEYKEATDNLENSFFGISQELNFNKNPNATKLKVLINGKRPSEYRFNYHIERPSKGFNSWMPAINKVTFGKSFPKEEVWTISIFNIDRALKVYDFRISGSKTGFDGEGKSNIDFTSNSGVIKINKEDHNLFKIENIIKKPTPEEFKVKFKVNQLVKDTILIVPNKTKYLTLRSKKQRKYKVELFVLNGGIIEDFNIMSFKSYLE